MTQEQKFEVVKKFDGYELRQYDPCVLAQVAVTGEFESAGNRGFGPLIAFISGRNNLGSKVAMTAPVIQHSRGDEHVVSFVMPKAYSRADLPDPSDQNVSLNAVPSELVAVHRFSGRWTKQSYLAKLGMLLDGLNKDGLIQNGEARFARFDPPWTPWFLRRNEIQVPVRYS